LLLTKKAKMTTEVIFRKDDTVIHRQGGRSRVFEMVSNTTASEYECGCGVWKFLPPIGAGDRDGDGRSTRFNDMKELHERSLNAE
jgi:hypothetical protein